MPSSESFESLSSPLGEQEFISGQELWQWRVDARQQAIAADISAAEVDWFLQELTGLDRLALRLESFKNQITVPLKLPWSELTALWQQRTQARVPVQYLTGMAPWRQFCLKVSPAVLIPRPETECLIDLAIAAVQNSPTNLERPIAGSPTPHSPSHWADLGTGSGAVAIGLATAFPEAAIYAVDQSTDALAIAQANARSLKLDTQVQFYQGSWFQPLSHLKGNLSGMISNPPYIPSQLVPNLQPEVVWHEPHLALDGGTDGLECIRHLVSTAPDYLHSGGIWLVEMMAGQAIAVTALLHQQGSYRDIQIHADLAGIDRFALAYRV